jgi:hypothetical protein
MQAMRRLCVQPEIVAPPVVRRPTPPSVAEVESQVEAVRRLRYLHPVNVEPVSPHEIDRRLRDYFDKAYPKPFYARRTDAWATIGAIPGGIGILEALNRYQQGQVLGFYNSQNGELVYTGDEQLSRIEQFILAHELTHAIDDQHFDLDRLDDIAMTCQDERFLAALGTVEGSANYFATQVIFRFPVTDIGDLPGGGTEGVPPLIVELQAYPYTLGQIFVDSLADDGGPAAVDRALRTFPSTTEQVLHPAKFPGDAPQRVDIPDFAPTFGPGWRDHDVMVVGEVWLRALLHTRLGRRDLPGVEQGARRRGDPAHEVGLARGCLGVQRHLGPVGGRGERRGAGPSVDGDHRQRGVRLRSGDHARARVGAPIPVGDS